MTAGLPGVGIGGLFYLVSALLMPAHCAWWTLRGAPERARWGLALRQASIAAGILGALWLTGWLLGWLIATAFPDAPPQAAGGRGAAGVQSVVRASALALSLGTLSLVLLLVQVARVMIPRRSAPPQLPQRSRAA